jgi:hypothetical protein
MNFYNNFLHVCHSYIKPKDASLLLHPELKKIKVEFRVDDGSEDLEG